MHEEMIWEIPKFEKTILSPRTHRYCILIPVLNEGERILRQAKAMRPYASQLDIVIVDGGSTDGVLSQDFLSEHRVRALLIKTDEGALSSQLRIGLAFCLREGYEGVILMDGNNKDSPEALASFVTYLDQGYDHIQGSRFVPGGRHLGTPLARLLGIKLIHAPLMSLACGFRYTDTTNGFRAYSRRLLLDPHVAPFREVFRKYELHYYLAIRAVELKYSVIEIAVGRSYPAKGPTPTKISKFRGNYLVLKTLINACLRRYHVKTGSLSRI